MFRFNERSADSKYAKHFDCIQLPLNGCGQRFSSRILCVSHSCVPVVEMVLLVSDLLVLCAKALIRVALDKALQLDIFVAGERMLAVPEHLYVVSM